LLSKYEDLDDVCHLARERSLKPTMETIEVGALIERQKLGWFGVSLLFWACAIMAIEGYDMQVVAYAAPTIIKEWNVNKAVFGQVFGLGLFGYMLGATLVSNLGDRIGRKTLIICGCLLFGAFTVASGHASHLTVLLVLRFIAGIGLGAAIPNTIALAAEYTPAHSRATTIGIMFIGYNLGGALGGVLAARYIPSFGWPFVFYVGGYAPIILAAGLTLALPESVRFLALHRHQSHRIGNIMARLAPCHVFSPETRFTLAEEHHGGLAVKHLFTGGRAVVTTLLWVSFVASLMGHYFLTSWLPTVLAGARVPLADAVLTAAVFQLGGGVGNLVVCRFLDKRGVTAVAVAFAIAAPLTILIAPARSSTILLMIVVFFAGLFVLGGQVGLNAISGTIYPTYIRSSGAGWAFGVGRIGSILGPVLGGYLINVLATRALFICASVPMVCCAGAILLLARATAAELSHQKSTTPS
jgi:MFS transporter, AAHS family, 4-hydroxybenzoate transporter